MAILRQQSALLHFYPNDVFAHVGDSGFDAAASERTMLSRNNHEYICPSAVRSPHGAWLSWLSYRADLGLAAICENAKAAFSGSKSVSRRFPSCHCIRASGPRLGTVCTCAYVSLLRPHAPADIPNGASVECWRNCCRYRWHVEIEPAPLARTDLRNDHSGLLGDGCGR